MLEQVVEIGKTCKKVQAPTYSMQHYNLYLQLQENLSYKPFYSVMTYLFNNFISAK